jgi:hypothetical protein
MVIQGALTAPNASQRCLLLVGALGRLKDEAYCCDDREALSNSLTAISNVLMTRISDQAEWDEVDLLCRLLQSILISVPGGEMLYSMEPVEHEVIYSIFLIFINEEYQKSPSSMNSESSPQLLLDTLLKRRNYVLNGIYCIDLAQLLLPILNSKFDCPWNLRYQALRVFEYLSSANENRRNLALVESFIDTVSGSLFLPDIDEANLIPLISRILMNVASCVDNQPLIAENSRFMKACSHILKQGKSSSKEDILLAVWRMASHPLSLSMLLRYRRGAVIGAIATVKGPVSVITKALQIIQRLIDLTASTKILINESVQDLMLRTLEIKDNQTVRLAAYFFLKLVQEDFIRQDERVHAFVTKALCSMSTSLVHEVRLCAAVALLHWASPPCHCLEMATTYHTPHWMHAGIRLANDPHPMIRLKGFEIVAQLAAHEAGAQHIALQSGMVELIVTCLTGSLYKKCRLPRKLSIVAIDILIALSEHVHVKHRIAKERGVIQALAMLGSSSCDQDRYLRNKALHGVILLAPLL